MQKLRLHPDLLNQGLHLKKVLMWFISTLRVHEHCSVICLLDHQKFIPDLYLYPQILWMLHVAHHSASHFPENLKAVMPNSLSSHHIFNLLASMLHPIFPPVTMGERPKPVKGHCPSSASRFHPSLSCIPESWVVPWLKTCSSPTLKDLPNPISHSYCPLIFWLPSNLLDSLSSNILMAQSALHLGLCSNVTLTTLYRIYMHLCVLALSF